LKKKSRFSEIWKPTRLSTIVEIATKINVFNKKNAKLKKNRKKNRLPPKKPALSNFTHFLRVLQK